MKFNKKKKDKCFLKKNTPILAIKKLLFHSILFNFSKMQQWT